MFENFNLSTWPARLMALVAAVFAGYITVRVVCFRENLVPLLFEFVMFGVLVGLAQFRLANMVLAFVLADHLCQFLKRMIFVLGPQSRMVYYGFQLMPAAILGLAGVAALYTVSRQKIPPSTKVLIGYIAVCGLTSIIHLHAVSVQTVVIGLIGLVISLMAILVGMSLPLRAFQQLSKLLVALIVISVCFGYYQFRFGPTLFDRVWADACKDFSIEAFKVYNAINYPGQEFRPYAYYNDHTTWGFFLAAAGVALLAMHSIGAVSKRLLYVAIPGVLIGLVLCETRVAALAFFGAIVTYWFITTRALRRPMLLILGVISFFGIVVSVGGFAVEHISFVSSNPLINRFATVGTLEARTSAWRLFVRNLPSHWLIGTGYGFVTSDPSVTLQEEAFSHNVFVELLVLAGLPGLLLFLGFFYMWMKEAFWVAQVSTGAMTKWTLWTVGLVTGMMLTGSLQGSLFMTSYLCLFMGVVSGEWARLQKAPVYAMQFPAFVPRESFGRVLQR